MTVKASSRQEELGRGKQKGRKRNRKKKLRCGWDGGGGGGYCLLFSRQQWRQEEHSRVLYLPLQILGQGDRKLQRKGPASGHQWLSKRSSVLWPITSHKASSIRVTGMEKFGNRGQIWGTLAQKH